MGDGANFTILSSSRSGQFSFHDKGKGGFYTRRLLAGMRMGKSLWQSHTDMNGLQIIPSDHPYYGEGGRQNPTYSGSPILDGYLTLPKKKTPKKPEELITDPRLRRILGDKSMEQLRREWKEQQDDAEAEKKRPKRGFAILVEGQPQYEKEAKEIQHDIAAMKKQMEELGFETRVVRSKEEYDKALAEAEEYGKKHDNDTLVTYFSGHGGRLKKDDTQGVFFFRNPKTKEGLEGAVMVNEADVLQPVKKASKQFNQTVAIFDVCHAGAFDTQFLTEKAPKPIRDFTYDEVQK